MRKSVAFSIERSQNLSLHLFRKTRIFSYVIKLQALLSLMSIEETTERLISILSEAATVKEPTTYKTGFWGRAQVYLLYNKAKVQLFYYYYYF